jgi:hypothetical protein
MSATTLVSPELEETLEPRKDAEHLLPRNGNGGSQSTLPVSPDSEIKKLDEGQLKAAIKSAWKKVERVASKEMGPLLYWLREKLRAPGSRNDLRQQDKGFGAWVEENLDVTRRTADSWANAYAFENGLRERKPTYGNPSTGSEAHEDDDFYDQELRKQGKLIQINYWVTQKLHKQYEEALTVLKKHFNTTSDKEAVVKGVLRAAGQIQATEKTRRVKIQSGPMGPTKQALKIRVRTVDQPAQRTRRNAKVAGRRGSATSSTAPDRSNT